MNVVRGTLEVEEWRPPEGARDRPARGRTPIFARGLLSIAVVALHVGAIALFALPAALHDEGARPSTALVMTATLLEAERSPLEERAVPVNPRLLEPPIAIAAPVSLDFPDFEFGEAEATESNEFRPPRLDEKLQVSPERFVADTGIAVARAARVILTVNVTEQGKAGDVSVAVGSGNVQLDIAAIEYARTLRWHPALVRGRESSMSIRLPVVFPATG